MNISAQNAIRFLPYYNGWVHPKKTPLVPIAVREKSEKKYRPSVAPPGATIHHLHPIRVSAAAVEGSRPAEP